MLKSDENFCSVYRITNHFKIKKNDALNLMQIKERQINQKIVYTENYQSYYVPLTLFNEFLLTETELNKLIIDEKIIINNALKFVPIEKSFYIYFLIDKNEIVYIGQTCDILSRISMHRKDKTFEKVTCFKVKKNKMLLIETMNIYFYRPKLNRSFIDSNLELFRLILKHSF